MGINNSRWKVQQLERQSWYTEMFLNKCMMGWQSECCPVRALVKWSEGTMETITLKVGSVIYIYIYLSLLKGDYFVNFSKSSPHMATAENNK